MTKYDDYYTTEEAAELLNKSKATIYKYIKEGKLTPLQDHRWRMLRTKVFPKEQVDSLAEIQEKKLGLTTTEAANRLGVHRSTLYKFVKDGILPSIKGTMKGREVSFIKEEDLEKFSLENADYLNKEQLKKRSYLDSGTNTALFQKFESESGKVARIIFNKNGETAFLFEDNDICPYEVGIYKYELRPSYSLNSSNEQNKNPGYAKFIMPAKAQLTWEFLDYMYQQVNTVNILINMDSMEFDHLNNLEIYVKRAAISDVSVRLYEYLLRYVKEGELYYQNDGFLLIDTDIDSLTLYIPKKIKERMKERAIETGTSMQELALQVLQDVDWERILPEKKMDQ